MIRRIERVARSAVRDTGATPWTAATIALGIGCGVVLTLLFGWLPTVTYVFGLMSGALIVAFALGESTDEEAG